MSTDKGGAAAPGAHGGAGVPVRTTCPYCGVGCGVVADAAGNVAGDPDHPANFGRLCSKGTALGETLSLDGRLLHPEIDGAPADWDTALDLVAERFAATIAEHGPDSVALYVSGQLLTEDYYAANKLTKGFLGTGNIDSNSRLCMASAVAGHRRAFGEDVVPGIYADLEQADLVVLIGSNTAWCHPVLYQRIVAARAARPGMRLVVIDPRRTATCEGAELHLPLAPGSDVALFGGLLAHLHRAGATDSAYVAAHVAGLDAALAAIGHLDVPATAAACGLDAADVQTFFDWFAATPRVVSLFSQGVNQSSAGTDKTSAIINVHLLTGRVGRPGCGPFSITGQPNAMGGREVGALANMLAAHMDWSQPGDAERLARFWGSPALAPAAGLKAVDMFRAVATGQVRAIWIIATNPAVSMPESDAVRAALAACPFVVVSDCVRDSDTMDLATIRLPALAWGEKDGTVTNSERVISRQRAFLPAPGQARPDWWAIAQVAARLSHGSAFAWTGPADIFREHAALSGLDNDGRRLFDISALRHLSDAGYADMPPTRWPCPEAGPAAERMFADGGFPTGDRRARLVPTHPRAPARAVSPAFPLVLNTGRLRDQWHTMTRTGKTPRLLAHTHEPVISVHPDDAGALQDGALAHVTAAVGAAVLRVRLDPSIRPGSVYAPMHWTDRFCPAGRINQAVNADVDPVSFQPELKHTPVALTPFAASWHGFVLSRVRPAAALAAWWALLPAAGGIWRTELAGTQPPAEAFAELQAALAAPGESWMALRDPAAGLFRAALLRHGRLEACLFIGPAPALPPRDWLVACFAEATLAPAQRRALLAGQMADGPAPEPPVCVCHGVGASAIAAAIGRGCHSVEAVGAATKAGTNCGSCRPEIRSVLAAALVPA